MSQSRAILRDLSLETWKPSRYFATCVPSHTFAWRQTCTRLKTTLPLFIAILRKICHDLNVKMFCFICSTCETDIFITNYMNAAVVLSAYCMSVLCFDPIQMIWKMFSFFMYLRWTVVCAETLFIATHSLLELVWRCIEIKVTWISQRIAISASIPGFYKEVIKSLYDSV